VQSESEVVKTSCGAMQENLDLLLVGNDTVPISVRSGGVMCSTECRYYGGMKYDSVKAKFHYAILVADRSEAGRRPAPSWNLAYLASIELAGAS